MKTKDLHYSQRREKPAYESPETGSCRVDTEGILCSSTIKGHTLDSYVEDEFDWSK